MPCVAFSMGNRVTIPKQSQIANLSLCDDISESASEPRYMGSGVMIFMQVKVGCTRLSHRTAKPTDFKPFLKAGLGGSIRVSYDFRVHPIATKYDGFKPV